MEEGMVKCCFTPKLVAEESMKEKHWDEGKAIIGNERQNRENGERRFGSILKLVGLVVAGEMLPVDFLISFDNPNF